MTEDEAKRACIEDGVIRIRTKLGNYDLTPSDDFPTILLHRVVDVLNKDLPGRGYWH